MNECIFNRTAVISDGHFDAEKAKSVFASAEKNSDWKSVIEEAIDDCETQGNKDSNHQLSAYIYIFLQLMIWHLIQTEYLLVKNHVKHQNMDLL